MRRGEQSGVWRPYHGTVKRNATESVRAGIGLAVLAALGWLGGCSDSPIGPSEQPPQGLIVSDPVPPAGITAGSRMLSARASSAADEVAYVSLAPGTVPTGSTATIRRVGDAATLTTPVIDGGFDPVPVAAEVGDSVQVLVTDAGGATIAELQLMISASRPPIVVRTNPPRRKTGVPLNSVMVLVFSEPMAAGTLTSSSVRLFRGTTPIPGTVSLLQGTATAAVFEPTAQLAANTEYRLVVTRTVKDLSGDALAEEGTAEFTTGATLLGAVASVSIDLVDSTQISVGSQWQLTATAKDDAGRVVVGRPVLWSSMNPSVATVSVTGVVTAVAAGDAYIRAEIDGQVDAVLFMVFSALEPIGSVTLTPESLTAVVGGRNRLLTMVLKDSAGRIVRPRPSRWTSSDSAIAVAVQTFGGGWVTGLAEGVVRIVATVEGKSDTSVVTVIPVGSVEVSPESALTVVSGWVQVSVVVRGAAGESLDSLVSPTWTSSDYSVAGGSQWVRGNSAGTATITVAAGGKSDTTRITVVNGAPTYAQVSAGRDHTCGVGTDGFAWCWGQNSNGQLGTGWNLPPAVSVPVAVADGHRFSHVGVYGHSCGLTPAGTAYCWGGGVDPGRWVPVAVSGGLAFTALEVGGAHACALTASGAAYCWETTAPVAVAGGLAFTALDVSDTHTCALTATGAAYCWGGNTAGQLGDGTTTDRSSPVEVAGGLAFVTLTAGLMRTCGLTADGSAYCWGRNSDLGIGTTQGPEFCEPSGSQCSTVPVPVLGDLRWIAISAGSFHTCAVTTGGAAYCWGYNAAGELGNGSTDRATQPVAVVGGLTFASVTTSSFHSCGVTPAGIAYCWGSNSFGKLGDGTSQTSSSVPVKVADHP